MIVMGKAGNAILSLPRRCPCETSPGPCLMRPTLPSSLSTMYLSWLRDALGPKCGNTGTDQPLLQGSGRSWKAHVIHTSGLLLFNWLPDVWEVFPGFCSCCLQMLSLRIWLHSSWGLPASGANRRSPMSLVGSPAYVYSTLNWVLLRVHRQGSHGDKCPHLPSPGPTVQQQLAEMSGSDVSTQQYSPDLSSWDFLRGHPLGALILPPSVLPATCSLNLVTNTSSPATLAGRLAANEQAPAPSSGLPWEGKFGQESMTIIFLWVLINSINNIQLEKCISIYPYVWK